MELQKALLGGMTLSELEQNLGIKAKKHPKYQNLVMFKYDMIDSPMSHPIVRESRGVILDSANGWSVVARPFDKFFNVEEVGNAAKIDWQTARVQEKLDGSLMIMYFYQNEWHIASSGLPDAGGRAEALAKTFSELFWSTWDSLGYSKPDDTLRDITFMFELMTPFNKVVVPHAKSKIALIGARHRKTGLEVPTTAFSSTGWSIVKEFSIGTLAEVLASFEHFSGLTQEGYVVVDNRFNRVKIKHPGYVAVHHMKGNDGPSHKRMLEIVISGEGSEVLSYFPEWTPIYEDVKSRLESLIIKLEAEYAQATAVVSSMFQPSVVVSETRLNKEFASLAVKSSCSACLFALRSGKSPSVRKYLAGIPTDRALKLIGLT